MDRVTIDDISTLLLRAHAQGRQLPPLTRTYGDSRPDGLTVDDAYAVQARTVQRWLAAGRTAVGYKIGLTSRETQRSLGVDSPDHGVLFADSVVESTPEQAAVMSTSELLQPKAEPEIALILGTPLTGTTDPAGTDVATAARAVGEVAFAFEIVDSRIADWEITLADTVADNGSGAGVVLGAARLPAADVELRQVEVELAVNGEVVGVGTGAAVLGDPLRALGWLADDLAARGGRLEAGDLVLTGSLTTPWTVSPGDELTAVFAEQGLRLDEVGVRFT